MLVSEFNYQLPAELIAQEPLPDRAASRLLRVNRRSGKLDDSNFANFPALLRADDLVVFNNTRVFPARLYGRRSGAKALAVSAQNPAAHEFLKGQVEVLLTRKYRKSQTSGSVWSARGARLGWESGCSLEMRMNCKRRW